MMAISLYFFSYSGSVLFILTGDEPDLADKGRSNSEKATSKEKSSSRDVRSRSPNRRGQSSRESRDRRETWNRDRRPGGYGGPSGRGRYGSGRGDYGRRGGRMDGGRGDRADPVAAEKIRVSKRAYSAKILLCFDM